MSEADPDTEADCDAEVDGDTLGADALAADQTNRRRVDLIEPAVRPFRRHT